MLLVILLVTIILLLVEFPEKQKVFLKQINTTGLGDRLLDITSVMSREDCPMVIQWNTENIPGRTYDQTLIEIEGCDITDKGNPGGLREVEVRCILHPGTDSPVTPEDIERFREYAKKIRPVEKVRKVLPKPRSYCVIHIRGTDKLVGDDSDATTMSMDKFNFIRSKCLEYIKKNHDETWYICTDDSNLKEAFKQECPEGTKFIDIDYKGLDESIVDFFAMANAKKVVQCTKYSTFSMFASVVGGIPLINFNDSPHMGRQFGTSTEFCGGTHSWDWKPVTISE